MPEECVELIHLVSTSLRMDLHFEIYSPGLVAHPFFSRYNDENPHVMKRVCHGAMSTSPITSGDIIFQPGEKPQNPQMWVLVEGLLTYVNSRNSEEEVTPGYWACEAVLWTDWITCGTLTAKTDSRLYTIDARQFQSIALQFNHSVFSPLEYASRYVERLNNGEVELSDLPPEDDFQIARRRRQHGVMPGSLTRLLAPRRCPSATQ